MASPSRTSERTVAGAREVLSRARAGRGRDRPGRWARRPRGVQDVVATIIILAIAVVLAGIVVLWVNTYPVQTPNRTDVFAVNLTYGGTTCVLNCGSHFGSVRAPAMNGINIELLAGPRIVGATISQSSVRLASQQVPSAFPNPFTLSSGLGGSVSWSPGQTWSLNLMTYGIPYYDNLTIIVSSGNDLVYNAVVPGPNPIGPPYFTSATVTPSSFAPGATVAINATIVASDGITDANPAAGVWANVTQINGGPPDRPAGAIATGSEPDGVAYDTSNGNLYVANYGAGSVWALNASSLAYIGSTTVGTHPEGIAYNPDNGEIYVADYGSNGVSIINPASRFFRGVTTVSVGTNPTDVAYDNATSSVYVTNYGSGTVSVIDTTTNRVTATVTVATHPSAVAFDYETGNLYVANFGSNSVSVIKGSTNTVSTTVTVGSQPDGVAYDGANGDLYVENFGSSTISVIKDSTNTVVATIHTGKEPSAAAFDPANGQVYVTDESQANVTVINGSADTVVGAVNVGSTPEAIAYDGATGELYTANYGSNNVTVIATTSVLSVELTYYASSGTWGATFTTPSATPAGTFLVYFTAVDNQNLTSTAVVTVVVT